ncbi:hypothetical protein MLH43_20305 [Escherichia coli]|nr:hypothetical protein [Escherichia coli]MDF7729141.1 hypothetical protein [Enterobacter hormaechei subsp. steigerwaltii]MCN3196367.1 hypothetical protein [Escherichia coli]MCN9840552.1 hypothetical protein [Escherichia coli]MDU2735899.1 hypothetical protein [Escherichia coli]MDZ9337742.1 hypothetical protein [Escherichia coli]
MFNGAGIYASGRRLAV